MALLAIGDRGDRRVPFAAMLIASFLVGLSLVFNGERHGGPSAGNEVLFLWVALYAGYYFRGSALRVQLLAVALADAAALLIIAPGDIGYTRWLITTGGAVIAGTVVHRLRKRNDELLGELVEAGRTDQLTNLANRRGFDNTIGGALARSVRSGSPLALVLGDLDHFKRLNDTLGHVAGDEALELVGDVVAALIRRGDTAARLGGDEFAVILPDTDATAALALSERLRSRISEHRNGDGTVLSMSFGIAVAPIPCRTALELMRAADIALYAAKRAGGNQALYPSSTRLLRWWVKRTLTAPAKWIHRRRRHLDLTDPDLQACAATSLQTRGFVGSASALSELRAPTGTWVRRAERRPWKLLGAARYVSRSAVGWCTRMGRTNAVANIEMSCQAIATRS